MGGTICRCSRQEDQVSKSILWLPWYYVNGLMEAIRFAEETLGRPPNGFEIFIAMQKQKRLAINNIYVMMAILFSMVREDLIYIEKNVYRYSLYKQEGFETYSELFRRHWPAGYECNSSGLVVPTTARLIDFRQFKAILLSTDE